MARFDDACVVVTGGASGIGEATVRGIVAEGGRAVIADLQEERGQALAQELGDAVRFHQTDVTSEDAIASAVATAESVEKISVQRCHSQYCTAQRCSCS